MNDFVLISVRVCARECMSVYMCVQVRERVCVRSGCERTCVHISVCVRVNKREYACVSVYKGDSQCVRMWVFYESERDGVCVVVCENEGDCVRVCLYACVCSCDHACVCACKFLFFSRSVLLSLMSLIPLLAFSSLFILFVKFSLVLGRKQKVWRTLWGSNSFPTRTAHADYLSPAWDALPVLCRCYSASSKRITMLVRVWNFLESRETLL